jgi:hypothetical protein
MKAIDDALELVNKHAALRPYSGRKMYGVECAALYADCEFDLFRKLAPALRDSRMTEEMSERVMSFARDSLGKGIIAYWPDVPLVPDFGDLRSLCQSGDYESIPEPVRSEQEVWARYIAETGRHDFERLAEKSRIMIGKTLPLLGWEVMSGYIYEDEVSGDSHLGWAIWAGQIKLGEVGIRDRILWCFMAILHAFDEREFQYTHEGTPGKTRYGLHQAVDDYTNDPWVYCRNDLIDCMVHFIEAIESGDGHDVISEYMRMTTADMQFERGQVRTYTRSTTSSVLSIMAGVLLPDEHLPFYMGHSPQMALEREPSDEVVRNVYIAEWMRFLRSAMCGGFAPVVIFEIAQVMWSDTQKKDLKQHGDLYTKWFKMFALARCLETY